MIYPGVNARIIAPFLLIVIAIAAVGIYYVVQLVTLSLQERFENQLYDSADSAVNTIVDIEREHLSTLRAMTFTEGVSQAISEGDTQALDGILRQIAANNRIDELIVFNDDGEVILYLVRLDSILGVEYGTPPTIDISEWASAERILNDEVDLLGDKFVEILTTDDVPRFYFSAPVADDAGDEVVGGIYVGIRAETLARRISEQALSTVTLITTDGEVLSSTFRADTAELVSAREDLTRPITEVSERNSPIVEVVVDDVPYQAVYAPFRLRSQEVGVLSVALRSEVLQQRQGESSSFLGLVFASAFVVTAVIGLVIARSITLPVEQLVSTTRAIRGGDLSRRVELRTPDELGELGVSFDEMTDRLVRRNQEIQQLYDRQVEQTAQREAMLTSISDAVIVQDTEGHILLSNDTAGMLMTKTMNDLEQARLFRSLLDDPQSLAQPQIISLAGYHFSVLATPVQMSDGEPLGYVIVFRDITAIIQSEALKDELILQMSHELRTPLGAVRGFVDLIKMIETANLSDKGVGFVDKARDHLTTLERLVDQVVDVSAMISGRFTIGPEEDDLIAVLDEAFAEWQPKMTDRDHHLMLSVSHHQMCVEIDRSYFVDVINYILQNAHDYTLPGGFISIHAESTQGEAIIIVQDTGVGIAPDEIEQVFERMYRGRSAEAGPTDARGLGLGLYMSRQIVEAHNGTITLESEPGMGTTVMIRLPLRQPETPMLLTPGENDA